jgi:hypothetical protein
VGTDVQVNGVDTTVLTLVVRKAIGDDGFAVTDWTCRQVFGGRASTTVGIYRFTGTRRGAQSSVWSVILKVIGRAGGSDIPSHTSYWCREPLILRSGLLDRLPPGLRAPHCLQIDQSPDGTWVWLEDVQATLEQPWPLDRFALTARHLGTFNGEYLTRRPLPDYPWLNRGLLRSYLDRYERELPMLARLVDHPLVKRGWTGNTLARVRRLWDDRHTLLAALERLPRTFCHLDATDQNLLAVGDDTVALDWAWAGIGAIGEELAVLLRSLSRGSVSYAAFDSALFENYLAGLRASGWTGDEHLVRLGYTATVALRYALNPFPIHVFEDDAARVRLEQSFDWPLERIVDWVADLRLVALDLAEEAMAIATISDS